MDLCNRLHRCCPADLFTVSARVWKRRRCCAASPTASPELQLQQTLPHIATVQSQQGADIPLVHPDVLCQAQRAQEATGVQLQRMDGKKTKTKGVCGNIIAPWLICILRNSPLTTEGALKWTSSKLPSNMVLNAGSAKDRWYDART